MVLFVVAVCWYCLLCDGVVMCSIVLAVVRCCIRCFCTLPMSLVMWVVWPKVVVVFVVGVVVCCCCLVSFACFVVC